MCSYCPVFAQRCGQSKRWIVNNGARQGKRRTLSGPAQLITRPSLRLPVNLTPVWTSFDVLPCARLLVACPTSSLAGFRSGLLTLMRSSMAKKQEMEREQEPKTERFPSHSWSRSSHGRLPVVQSTDRLPRPDAASLHPPSLQPRPPVEPTTFQSLQPVCLR
jgi:hypothetical protein